MLAPTEVIIPGQLTLASCAACARPAPQVDLDPACRRHPASAAWCSAPPRATPPSMASTPASASWPPRASAREDLATLQLNLIRSHSVGVGEPLSAPRGAADAGAEGRQPGARHSGVRRW
jgi:histidine ammonia-lyase